MGQISIKYCEKCHAETKNEWKVDRDSSPGEPDFYQLCLRCQNEDAWTRIEDPNNKKLEDFL